jgi:glutaminyl-peptide cyclotransferase
MLKRTNFSLEKRLISISGTPKTGKSILLRFYFQEKRIENSNGTSGLQLKLENFKLGNHVVQTLVFSEGETDTINLPLKIYNDKAPVLYTYKVIKTYPHDQAAYTQGLEFYKDTLYESTGQYGSSTLRKTNFETGEVLQQV